MITKPALRALVLMILASQAYAASESVLLGQPQFSAMLEAYKSAPRPCPAPVLGGRDLPGAEACVVPAATAILTLVDQQPRQGRKKGVVLPLITGFRALGSVGSTGVVDGPGRAGNGRYTMLQADAEAVAMRVKTGYMEVDFYLAHDVATGRDTLRVAGRQFDRARGTWGPYEDATFPAQFGYDAATDRGSIQYFKDGRWYRENYFGGKAGTTMVIEFGGGWDHDFSRD